jgi:hypothetical protein
VSSVQRLLLVADLILLNEQETLSLNLDIVILLLRRTLAKTATAADASIRANFLPIAIGVGAT